MLQMGKVPRQVRIVEVEPRDGLQNEKQLVSLGSNVMWVRDSQAL